MEIGRHMSHSMVGLGVKGLGWWYYMNTCCYMGGEAGQVGSLSLFLVDVGCVCAAPGVGSACSGLLSCVPQWVRAVFGNVPWQVADIIIFVARTYPPCWVLKVRIKDEAIMVKCLAQGHKRCDRPSWDSNPHSGNTRTWVQCTRPLSHNTLWLLVVARCPDFPQLQQVCTCTSYFIIYSWHGVVPLVFPSWLGLPMPSPAPLYSAELAEVEMMVTSDNSWGVEKMLTKAVDLSAVVLVISVWFSLIVVTPFHSPWSVISSEPPSQPFRFLNVLTILGSFVFAIVFSSNLPGLPAVETHWTDSLLQKRWLDFPQLKNVCTCPSYFIINWWGRTIMSSNVRAIFGGIDFE